MLVGLALLGRGVSPIRQWSRTAPKSDAGTLAGRGLARQARAEIARLTADPRQLRSLLASERPDPVRAMALAQRVYVAQRAGTSATATARQALIAAAHRPSAAGDNVKRRIAALDAALERLKALAPQPAAAPAEGSNLHDARLALRTAG